MWISSTLPFIKRCLLSLLDRLGLPRLPSPVSLFLFLPCRVNGVLPSQPFHHSCPAARSIPGPSRPLCAQEECKGQWFGVWETELWWTMSVWSPDSVGALAWHHSPSQRGDPGQKLFLLSAHFLSRPTTFIIPLTWKLASIWYLITLWGEADRGSNQQPPRHRSNFSWTSSQQSFSWQRFPVGLSHLI